MELTDGSDDAAKLAVWNRLEDMAAELGFDEILEGSGPDATQMEFVAITDSSGTSAAKLTWHFDTYTATGEPRCFTGDAFKFDVPSCSLKKSDQPVATRAHGLASLFLRNDVLNSAISGFP